MDIKFCKSDPGDLKASVRSLKRVRNQFKLIARNGYLDYREDLRDTDYKYKKGPINIHLITINTIIGFIIEAILGYIIVKYKLYNVNCVITPIGIVIAFLSICAEISGIINIIKLNIGEYVDCIEDTVASRLGDKYQAKNPEIMELVEELDKSIDHLSMLTLVSVMSKDICTNKERGVEIQVNNNKIKVKSKSIKKDIDGIVSIDIDGKSVSYEFNDQDATISVVENSFKPDIIDFSWVDGAYKESVVKTEFLIDKRKKVNFLVDNSSYDVEEIEKITEDVVVDIKDQDIVSDVKIDEEGTNFIVIDPFTKRIIFNPGDTIIDEETS